MKVKELIEKLQKCNLEAEVIISIDSEGNRLATVEKIEDNLAYRDEPGRIEDVRLAKLTPALKKQGYSDEDVMEDGKPCIVLWP